MYRQKKQPAAEGAQPGEDWCRRLRAMQSPNLPTSPAVLSVTDAQF